MKPVRRIKKPPKSSDLPSHDHAMIIGYFASTGIKNPDTVAKIRADIEKQFTDANKQLAEMAKDLPAEQAREAADLLTYFKRDYLAKREARFKYENAKITAKVITAYEGVLENPTNLVQAEKARTHILYHLQYQGYGNAIIFQLPDELKFFGGDRLPQETVRADALYALMYSVFGRHDFVKDRCLSKSERAIKQRLETEKDECQSLLDNPKAFLEKIAKIIDAETLEPELDDPELDEDEDGQKEQREDKEQQESRENPDKDDNDEELEIKDSSDAGEEPVELSEEIEISDDEQEIPPDARQDVAVDNSIVDSEKHDEPLEPEDKKSGYRAYTKAYDEIVTAKELIPDPEELNRLYGHILKICDKRPRGWREPNIKQALATNVHGNFNRRQENGPFIDPSTLSSIVASELKGETSPPNIHLDWHEVAQTDTCVTLLLDMSGSMRGRQIAYTAQFSEIFGGMLERNGIPFEILGFTTKSWKGGQARDDWINSGKNPDKPGRLAELRHIVIKAQNEPWRRAKKNLGVLIKEGLLIENIDGEALQWARKRMLRQPYKRKILVPVSDGNPMDDSTLAANKANFLENHLHHVIAETEKQGIEVHAIGIGHSTTKYYGKSYTMDAYENPYIAAAEILELIACYAPGQEHKIRKRLREKKTREEKKFREKRGLGADRVTYKL